MKPRKNTILILLLGLLLVAFTGVMAQTPTKDEQKPKAEACCSMESCCCNGDSCKTMKKDMNHAEDHECCGCCAESCDMKMKHDATMKHDAMMKHDATMKHDMKGHKSGDCCKAKAKTKTKKAA